MRLSTGSGRIDDRRFGSEAPVRLHIEGSSPLQSAFLHNDGNEDRGVWQDIAMPSVRARVLPFLINGQGTARDIYDGRWKKEEG